jgi:hypothetical protein
VIEPPKPLINLKLALGSVALLMLGFFGGWQSQYLLDNDTRWHQYVAIYQALYIPNTLTHIKNTPQNQQKELDRVVLISGKRVGLDQLNSYKGLNYKRAQILGFEGKPLVQLTFLTQHDNPVALCILKASSLKTTAIETRQMEGMRAASWQKNGYAYLLIGGNDEALITDSALYFSTVL